VSCSRRRACRLPAGALGLLACMALAGCSSIPFLGPGPTGAPGTFSSTGSMIAPVYDTTAVRLADGRVLFVGGRADTTTDDAEQVVASAQIYDPKTGSFSLTGSMTTPRDLAAAVLLPNGDVLVVGGDEEGQNLDTAELYDPATGRFTATGSMLEATGTQLEGLWSPSALLLPGGKVLVSGYSDNAVELYDPLTGTFSAGGSDGGDGDGSLHYGCPALLPDGRVLCLGTEAAQMYDPATGSFSQTVLQAVGMRDLDWETTVRLADGRVLVTGASDFFGDVSPAEIFDPESGTFSSTGPMVDLRWDTTPATLLDGNVLFVGGDNHRETAALDTCELYDPATGRFSLTGTMEQYRDGPTATLLTDGRVLVAGSTGSYGSAELYWP